jgi:uncharacterized membrane protein YhfC
MNHTSLPHASPRAVMTATATAPPTATVTAPTPTLTPTPTLSLLSPWQSTRTVLRCVLQAFCVLLSVACGGIRAYDAVLLTYPCILCALLSSSVTSRCIRLSASLYSRVVMTVPLRVTVMNLVLTATVAWTPPQCVFALPLACTHHHLTPHQSPLHASPYILDILAHDGWL